MIQSTLIEDKKVHLNVIMEHFSFEMQELLDSFQNGDLTLQELHNKYHEIGTEGHDILQYREVLEHAKVNREHIKLHAGFIPRTYAKTVMREGEEAAIKSA